MYAYEAARRGLAFRRRHERGAIHVTGADRLEWLNGLLTNDLKPLTGGGSCYAAWLTPQGRMITDLIVVETGGETWLDVPAPLAPALTERLDRLIFAENVRVEDVSQRLTSVGVYGPGTGGFLNGVTDDGTVARAPAIASGLAGVHVYLLPARAAGLEEALSHSGGIPLDDEIAAVLRVEAGVPEFLVDMGEETIPLEAGLDEALSQTKGCYVGQEIIVRIRDRAHGRVARRLVGLSVLAEAVPRAPLEVRSDGRAAGRLTSAVFSPMLQRPIALATLLREFIEPGTGVTLEDGTAAVVVPLPFVLPSEAAV
jgi:folate-binding protein YgfZ